MEPTEVLGPDGAEFTHLAALENAVLSAARELMGAGVTQGRLDLRYGIDAQDSHRALVHSLPFEEAALIIPRSG